MNETNELQVVEPSSLNVIARAEIDSQISTAKQYPRHLAKVKSDMMSFATLDEETAQSCFYTVPRGGKNIQGPSVRLAEIAVSCYRNIRVGSRVVETVTKGETPHVVVQSVCHDLEMNVAVTVEKRRRIVGKKDYKTGDRKPIDEDDITLASNSGAAIAFRDAVFKVIPGALIKPVFEQAKKVAIGDAKTLGDRRAKSVEAFAKMGITKERVLQRIEKKTMEDIALDDLETLIGLYNAIKEGHSTIEEAFPATQPVAKTPDFPGPPANLAESAKPEPKKRGPKPAAHDTSVSKPADDGDLGPAPAPQPELGVKTEDLPPAETEKTFEEMVDGEKPEIVTLNGAIATMAARLKLEPSDATKRVLAVCDKRKLFTELPENRKGTIYDVRPDKFSPLAKNILSGALDKEVMASN
jgi:hypothetical protein